MSSIYTPRPAYQDLGGSIVLLSIVKRFPAFLQCEALFFVPESDLSQARLAASPLEFRDAVASLPVNAILAPVSGGAPLTLYVSKPGFEEDFKEVAGDIAVEGCDLVRAAPDAENPFFLIFGQWTDLPATARLPLVSPVSAQTPHVAAPPPVPPAVGGEPMIAAQPEAAPAVEPPSAQAVASEAPVEPVVVAAPAGELPAVAPEAPAVSEAPPKPTPPGLTAIPPQVLEPALPVEAPSAPVTLAAPAPEGLLPVVAAVSEKLASSEFAELGQLVRTQAQALAQTQALVQELAQSLRQPGAQPRQDVTQLFAGHQAALLAAVEAKLAQMQDQMANRQLMVARQAEAEQTERQMGALRNMQQEQATQLQALLVRLQNEQSEWQQETFKAIERDRQAQQQVQAERPAWFAAGVKELGRAAGEQGESLQAALRAQQDQIISLQKTISEWRSQNSARAEEPAGSMSPEVGVAVSDLAWKVEKQGQTVRGISTRLGLLFVLNVLLLAALVVGFAGSTAFFGAAMIALRPTQAPTYAPQLTPTPPLAVVPEPTVALTGVALKCAETHRGRGYYDCALGNGVAYPQALSLSIAPDGGEANGFFPSVTLGGKEVFPDPSTTLAPLGNFEVGQLKEFRLNLPCAAALGCAPTTFVVRVMDSHASVVPGSELLITSAVPALAP